MKTEKTQTNGFLGRGATLFAIAFILIISTILSMTTIFAAVDITQPKVDISQPANNGLDVAINSPIMIKFSEPMNSSTINSQTIQVLQRTTPQDRTLSGNYRFLVVQGTVTTNGLWAIFTPTIPLAPNQEFGNTYTVTVTDGAKDLAGNSLARNYLFSFSTGLIPFFTDSSTSQVDQTPILIEPTPVTPITTTTTPAPLPVATTNESSFPWIWIAAALVGLIVIILFISMAIGSKKRESKIVPTAYSKKKHSEPSPFGDVSPVIDIEGVGPEYAGRLNEMGIKNTKQLWEANPKDVARNIDVSVNTVESWQEMSELISVKDIGPQYAELLQRSGIHSIAALKLLSPTKLLAMVQKKQDSLKIKIQGNSLGHATVAHWIDEAKMHKATINL